MLPRQIGEPRPARDTWRPTSGRPNAERLGALAWPTVDALRGLSAADEADALAQARRLGVAYYGLGLFWRDR
jgi:hypothetical protein